MWGKEKLLVTSNFSFPHSVFKRLVLLTRKTQGLFGKGLIKQWMKKGQCWKLALFLSFSPAVCYHLKEMITSFRHIYFIIHKYLSFNSLPNDKIFRTGPNWKHLQTTHQMWLKDWDLFWGKVENIVGKGRKCWVPAFYLFSTMFSKVFYFKVVKSRDCVV